MIKIIEQKIFRETCEKCETIFSYEKEDISTSQTGMNEFEGYVRCPVCGKDIIVKLGK